jgi:hypothetical protein
MSDISVTEESTMFANTATRVSSNTEAEINNCIRRRTEENISKFAQMGQDAIHRRLVELDEEWDIERWVETMAPTISLIGLTFGLLGSKKWLVIPLVVQGFFLQHAIQGWCPPIPVLRRMGVRTAEEINYERNALKAIRGDYRDIPAMSNDGGLAHQALEAASRS